MYVALPDVSHVLNSRINWGNRNLGRFNVRSLKSYLSFNSACDIPVSSD